MAEAALRKLDRDLPRIDMRSPALIAKQRASTRPARVAMPHPLHIAFSGSVAERLRQFAEQRCESPHVLASALLAKLLESDMANDLLGDGRAEHEAPGQGRRPFGAAGSLTLRQCAVIHLIGHHADEDGWCRLSTVALSRLMPHEGKNLVADILTAMERRGVLKRGRRVGRGSPTPWQLTDTGRIVFEVLAGEAGQ